MTATELKQLIESQEFRSDLREMSSYLASIKQERPIVFCLAKHLWRANRVFQLEADLADLSIDGKLVEFKFHYDCDMPRLTSLLKRNGDRPFKEALQFAKTNRRSTGWNMMLKIYEDVCCKPSDIFVWVISSRDLSSIDAESRRRVCWSVEQVKHHPTYQDRQFLEIADSFLETLKSERPFDVIAFEIDNNDTKWFSGNTSPIAFPSTYHFRICEFKNGNGCQVTA